jgi:hypothetical protein
MEPIKVFCIVERSSPFGDESEVLATYSKKRFAEMAKKKLSNPYLTLQEFWAVKSGDKWFLLAKVKPVTILE